MSNECGWVCCGVRGVVGCDAVVVDHSVVLGALGVWVLVFRVALVAESFENSGVWCLVLFVLDEELRPGAGGRVGGLE